MASLMETLKNSDGSKRQDKMFLCTANLSALEAMLVS